MVVLTDEVIKSFSTAKVFQDNTKRINALDFSMDGEFLITSSDDESIHLYNCANGTMEKKSYCKKYGVDLISFTHHSSSVICASNNNWDQTLRYLSLHDNQYLRYFSGHRDKVVSLSMSPNNDTFLSGSLDGTVRLWDLRVSKCQGLLRFRGRPTITFDPEGIVFAGGFGGNVVKLYDARNFDDGPFTTFTIPYNTQLDWNCLKFSNDGSQILLGSLQGAVFTIDSFEGYVLHQFNVENTNLTNSECSFSPDGKYILCGTESGKIEVFNTSTGEKQASWNDHVGPVDVVKFNPKKCMIASGCTNLAFWLPEESSI